MKATFESGSLRNIIEIVRKAIDKKSAMPIMENVYMNITGGKPFIRAGGSEMFITRIVSPLSVDEEGVICVHAETLSKGLASLADQPVTLSTPRSSMLEVSYHQGSFTLPTEDAGLYPDALKVDKENAAVFTIKAQLLKACMNSCAATVDPKIALRQILLSVFFNYLPSGLDIVSTNGRSLTKHHIDSIRSEAAACAAVPFKAASAVVSVIDKREDDVKVLFDGERILFSDGDFGAVARLLDGKYPNYNSVIPTEHTTKASVNGADMKNALKRAGTLTDANTNRVILTFENMEVMIKGEDIDFGRSCRETIHADIEGDSPRKIAMKAPLLSSLLPDDDAILCLHEDSSRPMVVLPAEQKDDVQSVYMIAPMQME